MLAGRAGAALVQFWRAGGVLWALGLGVVSLFVWLPALHLASLGFGEYGQRAWQGLVALWPHPAWNYWSASLERWGQGLVSNQAMALEGWLIVVGLLALCTLLASVPSQVIWRNTRLGVTHPPTPMPVRMLWSMLLVLGPLGLGLLYSLVSHHALGPKLLALGLAALVLMSLQCFAFLGQIQRLRCVASLVFGAGLAVLVPASVLVLSYQVLWLGWLAGLPLVQLAFLGTVFSLGWAGAIWGGFMAASAGNGASIAEDFEQRSLGDKFSLALKALRLVERHGRFDRGAGVRDIAKELEVHPDEVTLALVQLQKHGLVVLAMDDQGCVCVNLALPASEIELFDVLEAFKGVVSVPADSWAQGDGNCLIYAAHTQRQSLNITLLDFFHFRSDDQPLGQWQDTALPLNHNARTYVADAPAIDFEKPHWEGLELSALRGLEGLKEAERGSDADFPAPKVFTDLRKKAS